MWLWANSSKIESVRSYEHYLHHRVSCLQKLSPAASTTSVLRLKNFWTIKNLERVRENQRVSQMWIVISASLCEFTTDKPFLVSYLFLLFFSIVGACVSFGKTCVYQRTLVTTVQNESASITLEEKAISQTVWYGSAYWVAFVLSWNSRFIEARYFFVGCWIFQLSLVSSRGFFFLNYQLVFVQTQLVFNLPGGC